MHKLSPYEEIKACHGCGTMDRNLSYLMLFVRWWRRCLLKTFGTTRMLWLISRTLSTNDEKRGSAVLAQQQLLCVVCFVCVQLVAESEQQFSVRLKELQNKFHATQVKLQQTQQDLNNRASASNVHSQYLLLTVYSLRWVMIIHFW